MEATLDAVTRSDFGKNEARRLRREGRIPAVVYGGTAKGTRAGQAIAVDPNRLLRILQSDSGANTLIQLKVEGGAANRVLIKEFQLDPIRDSLLHVDFYRVAMNQTITVTVPVVLKGEARGVKQQGGLLDFVHREVEVECLPGDIPEHIEVDVAELLIGQSVRLRDVTQDMRWKPMSAPDTMLVHVIAPKAEEVEEPAVEEAAATESTEPELIKKGKAETDKTERQPS